MAGNQSLDAGPTVTKPKRKPAPPKGATNWNRVRREWEAGVSPTTIAYRHGITYSSVYKRSRVEEWSRKPEATEQVVACKEPAGPAAPIQNAVKERLGRHFQQVLNQVEILQNGIGEHSSRRLEVEEIKSLSQSLDLVDRIARRTFGLDGGPGSAPGSLLATVAPAVLCPVVDVEPAPAPPAALPAP